MSDHDAFMVTDDQGLPVGMASRALIHARGDQLAFDLAAVCDQPDRIREILDAGMDAGGFRELGYVAEAALLTVLEDVVRPLMVAAEAVGVPLRQCFEGEAARAPGSACPVCGHSSHAVLELFGFEVRCLPPRRGEEPDGAL